MNSNITKFLKWKDNWKQKDSIGVLDYISYNFHPDDILIISELLFPKIIEIDGCLLLSFNYDANIYKEIKMKVNNETIYIEKNINRIRIYDVFSNCSESISEDSFIKIGELLKFSWEIHLKNKFKDKFFKINLINEINEYGPIIEFYQVNPDIQ